MSKIIILGKSNLQYLNQLVELRIKFAESELAFDKEAVVDYQVKKRMHAQTNQYLKSKTPIIIGAFYGTVLVGYLDLFLYPEVKNFAYIGELFVALDYRKKGIAKQLIQRAFVEARKKDRKGLKLNVFKRNEPAIALYQSLGFKIVKPSTVLLQRVVDEQ